MKKKVVKKIVCLNPGHGIETPGKRSFDGKLREYEFNRNIAKRMTPILKKMGYDVINTCPTDSDVSLANMCKIANDGHADVFISLHANAFSTTWNDASGWEVLIPEKGGNSEKLAQFIHKESLVLGIKDRGVKVDEHLYVLNNTRMPCVLIEHGFFTNLVEMKKLLSGAFRQSCAETNCKGIDAYFKSKEVKK